MAVIAEDGAEVERSHAPHKHSSYPRTRVSSTLRPPGSIAGVSGILDRPVKPGDDG